MKKSFSERGATLIEFSLVATLFFFIIIGFFDFVRYLTAQAILRTAASRAVSRASVIPNLDLDCPSLSSTQQLTCKEDREAAILNALKVGEDLAKSFVGQAPGTSLQHFRAGSITSPASEMVLSSDSDYRAYRVDIVTSNNLQKTANFTSLDSVASAGSFPTLRSTLRREPIQVIYRAQFHPILRFIGNIPLEGTAAGFREIQGLSSYPPEVNCRGIEVPIGETPNNSNCPCASSPGNPLLIAGGADCVCINNEMQIVKNGDGVIINCECPGIKIESGTSCVCPDDPCPDGLEKDQNTCACRCPGSLVETSSGCGCDSPYVPSGTQCVCKPNPTCEAAGGYLDGACQCRCPDLMEMSGGICVCKPVTCNGGTVDSSCHCICDKGFQNVDGTCTCPSPRHVDPADGVCKCPSVPCGNGGWIDGNSCTCQCPWGKKYDTATGGCVCADTTCNGGYYNNSACSCNCPSPMMSPQGGVCTCVGGSVASGSVCVCPHAGETWRDGACRCPLNQQVLTNGACGCPYSMRSDGTCFKDE